MDAEMKAYVEELAEHYRRHFAAPNYKESCAALEAAEALQTRVREQHGEDYARAVDRAAYAIGHG